MRVLLDGQTLATPEMGRGIGAVFSRLVEEMVVPEISIRWYMLVGSPEHIERLPRQVAAAVEPLTVACGDSEDPAERSRTYGAAVGELASRVRADWYWNANPLMPNVRFPSGLRGVRTMYTIHDLIPLRFPNWYLDAWPSQLADEYHSRCAEIRDHADVVVTDSRATADDFRHFLPGGRAQVLTAHCGSDYSLMYPLRCGMNGTDERYVLYVGGFDPRKNMEGAVRAFAHFHARLPQHVRSEVQFKIVCAHTGAEAKKLQELAASLGIGDRVRLLGYVDNATLGRLFRNAALFFFPSHYEGFGLPALDALACGVPVVAGRTSSIPEVCGDFAWYVDPTDVDEMAEKLHEAWERRCAHSGPWLEAAEYARKTFQWKESAAKYLAAFAEARPAGRNVPPAVVPTREPLAYLSPWPPQRTGVANYSFSLVPHLAKRRAVTVFTEVPDPQPVDGVEFLPLHAFREQADSFRDRVYHLGNNETHREIYRIAWDHPGIVVIHDYNIHPFLVHHFLKQGDPDTYRDALLSYGEPGAEAWLKYCDTGQLPNTWSFPMTDPVLARSRGAIVHSRLVERKLFGAKPVVACHLGVEPGPMVAHGDRLQARLEARLDPEVYYVGAFGYINRHKRIAVVAQSVAVLRSRGIPVVLLLVGEVLEQAIDVDGLRESTGLGADGLIHAGYVSEVEYDRYLRCVDIFVNLRFPNMGESSASLFSALRLGLPAIVTDDGPFAEIPDDAAWKVPPDANEAAVLTAYLSHLLQCPRTRAALGASAHRFVREFGTLARTSRAYIDCIARA